MTGVLYASLFELRQVLDIDDTANDVDLERALDAACRWIEGYTGRTFTLQTAQTRTYYPDSAYVVRTPDLVSVTSVAIDEDGDRTYGTPLAAADYQLRPLNEPTYQEIHIWPLSNTVFVPGRLVRVVGSFGATVGGLPPVEVRQSALLLASRYYKRVREAPFGVLQSTDLGQFTRLSGNDPDVVALLAPWRFSGSATWVMI